MPGRALRATAVLLVALGLAAALPAMAAVVYEDGFDGRVKLGIESEGEFVPSAHGQAWHAKEGATRKRDRFTGILVDLKKSGLSGLTQGTIELWVTRGEQYENEVFIAFADAQGRALAFMQMFWEGHQWGRNPEINLYGGDEYPLLYVPYTFNGGGGRTFRSPLISFGKPIQRGQEFHLALTWSGTGSGAIYLDGQRLPARVPPDFAMVRLLEDARYLAIGSRPEEGPNGPTGSESPSVSAIDGVRIDNTVMTFGEPGEPPSAPAAITSVTHDASTVAGFSGKLVAGNTLTATMEGTPGASATFDIARLAGLDFSLKLDWKGWGVYLEEKNFFEPGEVNLRDAEGYRVYLSTEPFPVVPEAEVAAARDAGAVLVESGGVTYRFDGAPARVIDDVKVQSCELTGVETGVPYYVAVVAEMDDRSLRPVVMPLAGIPMTESPDAPGSYAGTYTLGYADRYADAVLVGRLSLGSERASLEASDELAIDTALRISVQTSPNELKADEKGTSKVTVTVTDANEDEVPNHKMRFLLATTSQYTGVVGGGQFTDQVGGSLGEGFEGETDLFGKVTLTYQAGFAAKTAIIVARDMTSNDTGAGYVKTYITATAELELEPVEPVAAAELGYAIEVTSSDEWLTADGRSQAKITARVTLNDEPVKGHQISFAVTSGVGTIRGVDSTTDGNGKAHAVYTAGKKIGIVLITATDTTINLSGTVQIELRSDAPAKIKIRITPEKLPADGHSTADLLVSITDINDNPNEGVGMEYDIIQGSGRITKDDELTDRNGEAGATFVAGKTPGKVAIEVTVRSTVPTEVELASARDLALAVTDYDIR